MNKKNLLWCATLLLSFLMLGCATHKNTDVSANGSIDACKVRKPPENQDVLIMGDSFSYPNILNLANDYTGCVKNWIGDNEKHPPPYHYFIIGSKQFKNGHLIKTESYEIDFSGRTNKVERTCHFYENGELIADKSAKDCPIKGDITIEKTKAIYYKFRQDSLEVGK